MTFSNDVNLKVMSKNKLVNRIFTYSGFKVSEMSASNCANVFMRFCLYD